MDDINAYNASGRTKLMEAADAGDIDEVKRLLAEGADPTIKDANWQSTTAHMYALRKISKGPAYSEIARLLSPKEPSNPPSPRTYRSYESPVPSGNGCGLVGFFYILGFVSLLLAPFTGLTVVTAAAFFVIGYVLSKA